MEVQSGFEGIYIDPNPMHPFMGRPLYSGTDWAVEKGQFTRNTMADLRRLAATTLGAELIDLIGKRSQGIGTKASGRARSVTIAFRPSNNPGASTGASIRIDDKFGVTKRVGNRDIRFAGRGSAAKIQMHNRLGQSEGIYTRLAGVYSPVWVVLAHELIHALHTLSGTAYADQVDVPGPNGGTVRREEMWTTGIGPYADTRLSENKIRAEVGLPRRNYYGFPHDHTHISALTPVTVQRRPGYWYCACLQEHFGH